MLDERLVKMVLESYRKGIKIDFITKDVQRETKNNKGKITLKEARGEVEKLVIDYWLKNVSRKKIGEVIGT